jgi:aminoglycoside phosphotransferase (APT) family kinase protein
MIAMTARLHADEFDIDAALVRRLLATQLPGWAHLPLSRIASSGTDNVLFRLGTDLVVGGAPGPRAPAPEG